MSILKIRDDSGVVHEITVLRGPQGTKGEQGEPGIQGERGDSGVYIGTGDMPDDCNVQIDPNGAVTTMDEITAAVLASMPTAEGVGF